MEDAVTPRWWPHLVLAVAVLGLTSLGLGYRHLWLDEVDTAERARTILESGFPRVIDAAGTPSLNTAGLEIEDGVAHRYHPWAPFYLAASGLAVARALDLPADAGVRAPSVVLHAAVSGMVSYGLALTGVGLPLSLCAGTALGVQTVRMVYNRQARYHALLDFLVVLGLLGLAAHRHGKRWGKVALAVAIGVLPQTHVMSGSALSLTLGVLALAAWTEQARFPDRAAVVRDLVRGVVLPGLVSAVVVLLLTRPWAQTAWGSPAALPSRGLDNSAIRYGLVFAGLSAVVLLLVHQRRAALGVLAGLGTIILVVRVLDLHPFSTHRYYLSVPLLVALWPLSVGWGGLDRRAKQLGMAALVGALLWPDVNRGLAVSGRVQDFQGIRMVFSDLWNARQGTHQPLHQVLEFLRKESAPGEPVLFDAVPQFANWYLPGHPPALVPDLSARTPLNAENPVWQPEPRWPAWHVWYPTWGSGPWTCTNHCDYLATREDPARWDSPYVLHSGRLDRSVRMCPVGAWVTTRMLNAPFDFLSTGVLAPEGAHQDVMVLARPCPAATDQ